MEILMALLFGIIAICIIVILVVLAPVVIIGAAVMGALWLFWAGLVFITNGLS